jgi:hypothetical protein
LAARQERSLVLLIKIFGNCSAQLKKVEKLFNRDEGDQGDKTFKIW